MINKSDSNAQLYFAKCSKYLKWICLLVFTVALIKLSITGYLKWQDNKALKKIQEEKKTYTIEKSLMPTADVETSGEAYMDEFVLKLGKYPKIKPEYQCIYKQNQDLIGWLKIDDTVINYPVMQTPEDEDYYLSYDFYGNRNSNGCLLMDTDSVVGIGAKKYNYYNGTAPSTNLIIHGHTMKSGLMFGKLKLYKDKAYGIEHSIIQFDSLYEKREYELIAVFYSQVYHENQHVFKYYKFFQADSKKQFEDWYENIKGMSLYDTGVTAVFGDEFITLSCCSYQVEDGRFVVVGKRIK